MSPLSDPDPDIFPITKLDLDVLFVVLETAFKSSQKRRKTPEFGVRRHQNACVPEVPTTEVSTPTPLSAERAWVIKSIAVKCQSCIIGAVGHYQAAETGLLLHLSTVWSLAVIQIQCAHAH